MSNVLTCVYCGHQYPEGTPPHGSDVLTEHTRVCEKHPLRAAEEKIKKLREALFGLIGVTNKDELEKMEMFLRIQVAPGRDKATAINAIHALLDTP